MSSRPRFAAATRQSVRNGLLRFPVGTRVRIVAGPHRGAVGIVDAHHWPHHGFLSIQFEGERMTVLGIADGVAVNADVASEALLRLASEPTERCNR